MEASGTLVSSWESVFYYSGHNGLKKALKRKSRGRGGSPIGRARGAQKGNHFSRKGRRRRGAHASKLSGKGKRLV